MQEAILEQLRGGLIVSCQALEDEPLYSSEIMARMALAAKVGGAVGIRANTPVDVAAIRRTLPTIPIIGLYKDVSPDYPVYITPTLRHALELAEAGCNIIAIDATNRPRPENLADLISAIKTRTGLAVMADISTFEEGVTAESLGADLVSTTMSGYTDYSPNQKEPDLALVTRLSQHLHIPLTAEGRISTPQQARLALEAGAFAVVVGGAITRPQWITSQFVTALRG
jgi:N-acylglucosamine-6-phosphate 2-epimerase